eukprot:CAMPEP_0196654682 /NCGR_PEP_ID=MMETSP1086-20130531/4411_1 /TAXON_ID=77921 /ORGANISM="Cyanoptyche  gloeocystis , Strain SAG4.97" /LENGTH=174 /DNA_ID=CAMNT_0041986587 /DNA_START=37 /DNA_END=561 /DNA_ORIENTATION=-
MLGGFVSKLTCNAVLAWTAYKSYKAVSSNDTEQSKKLLVFWIVFAALESLMFWSDMIIFWFPFYYEARVALSLWIASSHGSVYVYESWLKPTLSHYEAQIDEYIVKSQREAKARARYYLWWTVEYLRVSGQYLIAKGYEFLAENVARPPMKPGMKSCAPVQGNVEEPSNSGHLD